MTGVLVALVGVECLGESARATAAVVINSLRMSLILPIKKTSPARLPDDLVLPAQGAGVSVAGAQARGIHQPVRRPICMLSVFISV